MTQTTDSRRGGWRAALLLAAGLGPAFVLPSFAATGGGNPVWTGPGSRAAVQRLIVSEAVGNGAVPAPLALAVAQVESDFVPRTVGASGAVGLMQLLPATAENEFGIAADALWEPATNVRLGLRRLANLHQRHGGDWELALSHFRGGELRKEEGRYRPHDYTRAYVERVMRGWRRYQRDPLVRAWIREANGVPRFAVDEAPHRFEARTGHRTGPGYWGDAYDPRPRDHGRDRRADRCREAAPPSWPGRHRFNGGGRWTPIEGAPASGFHRGSPWVAVTGGRRFR